MKSLLLVCVLGGLASAQPATSEADRLFDEGRALLEAGKNAEACAKFEQSIAKDPRAVGALMNLGLCNERSGKIATALKLFQEAFDRAVEANLAHTKEQAQDEITKLAPKVPHVALTRDGVPLAGEKLVVDDIVVPPDRTDLPLDPGHHVFVLTAPGRLPWEHPIDLEAAQHATVALPVLSAPKQTVVTRTTSARRTVGKVVTFSGVGIAIAGGVLAYYAKHDYDKLFVDPDGAGPTLAHCGAYPPIDGKATCDGVGQSRSERDANLGTAGLAIGTAGLVATAAGIVLWLTAPEETQRTTVTPMASPTTVGVVLTRAF